MAQWVIHLVHKHKDLSSTPPTPLINAWLHSKGLQSQTAEARWEGDTEGSLEAQKPASLMNTATNQKSLSESKR